MNSSHYREEKLYLNQDARINQPTLDVLKQTIMNNHAVGTIVGYYDEPMTILSVSDYLLNNLEYSYDEFMAYTKGSLKKVFFLDNLSLITSEHFRKLQGAGEGKMISADGTPIDVKVCKEDSVDSEGEPVWVMSVRVDWEHENLTLVNEAIQSGQWYMDCDRNGQIRQVTWSHNFRRMLGFHDILDFPNELNSWSDLLHPLDKQKTLDQLYAALADKTNQKKYECEYRLRMPDGSYQWFRAASEIKRRWDGSARRIAGVFINITQEKRNQMQIQKSNAFHQAFTKSNLCEYYVDLKNNTFESLKVEPSLLTIFEQSHTWDELIRALVDNYVCSEYRQEVTTFYNRDYIVEKLDSLDTELSLECQVMLNGERRWIRNVVLRGELEGLQYAMIFLRDITEAKKELIERRQMMEDNEAMEHLIHGMVRVVDHFAICDLAENTYEYHNINLDSNYAPSGRYSEFIRQVTEGFRTLESQEPLATCLGAEYLRQRLKTESDIYKFEYCSKDEKIFRMASFVPLKWENDVLAKVLWISMDITAQKKIEIESRKALNEAFHAAEHANKAKTEFLSNMSHDIRTPMNAIVGLTALAGANIDHQERVLQCLSKITKSSRHLLGLINEVLDMARIESGKVSLTDEEFDMSELVDNLITMVKPGIEEHGHHLEVSISHMEHEAVYGDSLRIQQIFTNLMSNAIKYTPDGGNISFAIEERPNGFSELGCFVFVIRDNGIGMSEEFQKIMFQPFSRADDHRTTKVQGTGLGMAITQNIVHMMNGEIKVKSAPNQGTEITVTIYLKLQNKKVDKINELKDLPVLVVDDDQSSCESTVATLDEIGIIGEWVTSGAEAVELVSKRHEQQEDFFAIIMDWQMPGMDGIETTRQIRKTVGNDVTIIVLTAYDYSEIEEEARAAGVDAFIEKPLFRSRLTATLRQLVTGKPEKSARYYLDHIVKSDFSDKTVLLVEDNDLNREIASEIIGMSKARVDTAVNGREAVEKIANAPEDTYDLVFMDIQMPEMNGYEATAAIRTLPGNRRFLPIIAMTANAFAEDVQMAKNTGMNGHIAKPLDLDTLGDTLRKWLND